MRYFRPSGTTATSRSRGDKDGQGEFSLPHTHSPVPHPVSLSLSPSLKNGAGVRRRISASDCPPVILSGGIVPHHVLLLWTQVFPQLILVFVVFFVSRFLGETCVF